MSAVTLDDLWGTPSPSMGRFEPDRLASLPGPARRYLRHAIAPGTPLAYAVCLRMHGEIKLGSWAPFEAEQVIHAGRGMIWAATARMKGLPVRGSDRIVDGEGRMRWRLLGLIPVLTASGPDITRAAAGRLQAELVWLPSYLALSDVSWTASDETHATANLEIAGHNGSVIFELDREGRPLTVSTRRWGNPGGREFSLVPFGAMIEAERAFGGYTIPSRLRVGWYFGTERFESEGEFFRCSIDEAVYRSQGAETYQGPPVASHEIEPANREVRLVQRGPLRVAVRVEEGPPLTDETVERVRRELRQRGE